MCARSNKTGAHIRGTVIGEAGRTKGQGDLKRRKGRSLVKSLRKQVTFDLEGICCMKKRWGLFRECPSPSESPEVSMF